MIRQLVLTDVGPARNLEFNFAPRLNVLTGDNGLGKTFALDVAWWVLTTTWAGEKAFPWRPRATAAAPQGGGGTGRSASRSANGEKASSIPGRALTPEIGAILTHRAECPSGEQDPDDPFLFFEEKSVRAPSERGVLSGGHFDWESQEWKRHSIGRPAPVQIPLAVRDMMDEAADRPRSLVVYARIDGTFAVWDAFQAQGGISEFEKAVVLLNAVEIWDGKNVEESGTGRRRTICRGLIEDWVTWQGMRSEEYGALRKALHFLSDPDEELVPGPPTRVKLDDRRNIPTLDLPYGQVPVTLASAGVRRILALAYVLVWAWTEHLNAAHVTGHKPTQDMVVLIDEVELHLHPRWQRVILPAVLKAIGAFAKNVEVQVLATTHSPLVLSSLEPVFNEPTDALFTFDVMPRGRRVRVEKMKWRPRGDASNWLTSDVFGLGYARSREAEIALQEATRALDEPDIPIEEARRIHHKLREALGDTDPFWSRWVAYAERRGIEP